MTDREKLEDVLNVVKQEIEDTDYEKEYHRFISLRLIQRRIEEHLSN